jgi:uncharacterized protein (TIGR03086 family)
VAAAFGEVTARIDGDGWRRPTPCTGWVARDVVSHLVEWVPALFAPAGIVVDRPVSVEDDPAGSWRQLSRVLQVALDDTDRAAADVTIPPLGTMPLSVAIGRFVTPDVLVHTWDLARSAGIDVELDRAISEQTLAGFEAIADMLVASGQFGPAVAVDEQASVQVRMLAASGRDPRWQPPAQ